VALHAGGDWDWQLPAVVLPGVALAAGAIAAMGADGERGDGIVGGAWRWVLAGSAVAAILVVAGPVMSARATDDARSAASRGDLASALARADEAIALSPQDPDPRHVRANILSDLGRNGAADSAFAAAAARSPRDWSIFADWADALARRGERRGALQAAARARELNPLEPRVRYLTENLGQ
jgi:Flp pilus assembly protein TadD